MKALSRWTYVMVALSFLATSCTSIDEMLDSYPPRFPIYKMFKADEGRNRLYPPGQEMQYVSKKYSDGYVIDSTPSSSAEARERERLNGDLYNTIRKAAEVHRRVRKYAVAELIRPGVRLIDMCEALENATRTYLEADKSPLAGLKAGIGFPTGCSLNNCAAHYTPNPGDDTVLKYDDVMKLDFGTHVNGYIVDSAFTWAPNPKYEQLMAAVKDATYTGIKEAGIDARLKDVGEAIQEVMESYEVVLDGKTHQVKCVENLMGHSIQPYIIHGGKSVPITRGGPSTRMEEGEVYAIETFGTTGRGMVREVGDCSHFSLIPPSQRHGSGHVKMARAKQLMQHIDKHFSTLPWCRRYLERSGESRYVLALRSLVDAGVVEEYPPLCDVKGSYVAQYEHTIILRPTCKEIVSKGDDW